MIRRRIIRWWRRRKHSDNETAPLIQGGGLVWVPFLFLTGKQRQQLRQERLPGPFQIARDGEGEAVGVNVAPDFLEVDGGGIDQQGVGAAFDFGVG